MRWSSYVSIVAGRQCDGGDTRIQSAQIIRAAQEQNFIVPANTRHTVLMYSVMNPGDGQTDGAGPGFEPLGIVLSSDLAVLVEKPTYSSNASTYGATDTVAYSPGTFLLTP